MSFLVSAALAVGLLVVVPIVAHLLRRGRTREVEFPPAALVPVQTVTSQQRSRLQDRSLLALRGLLIVALAVLGATPFVKCSRLSVSREAGASVAIALVIDDSHSMNAGGKDGRRWERALGGVRDLMNSAREGDAFALVLAGAPARLELTPTTDLGAVREALGSLAPTNRSTDLDGAVKLARATLKSLPHRDKRVVLLSDLAGEPFADGVPPVWTPLPELADPQPNCAVVSGEVSGRSVSVKIACSDASAARDRKVKLSAIDANETLAEQPLAARAGLQHLSLTGVPEQQELQATLSGDDRNPLDDRAPLTRTTGKLAVGVLADPATASVVTGGPTILEQGLLALEREIAVRPLTVLPDDESALSSLSCLILDDPPGLSPEAREALGTWIARGGVAVALLGPNSTSAQLSSTLEPFARGGARWEESHSQGIDDKSLSWLGKEAATLGDLTLKGRMRLDGAALPQARVRAVWDDGVPWIFERRRERGLLVTVGLPVSVDASDFALRPGFLALLGWVLDEAAIRSGPSLSVAGSRWTFPASSQVQITGPHGPLQLDAQPAPNCGSEPCEEVEAQQGVELDFIGRYEVRVDGDAHFRAVTVDPEEILLESQSLRNQIPPSRQGLVQSEVDISTEIALLVLVLFVAELGFRVIVRVRRRRSAAQSA